MRAGRARIAAAIAILFLAAGRADGQSEIHEEARRAAASGAWSRVETLLAPLVEDGKQDPVAWGLLGHAHEALGREGRARQAFAAALAGGHDALDVLVGLARLELRRPEGSAAVAADALRRARLVDPDDLELARALVIAALRADRNDLAATTLDELARRAGVDRDVALARAEVAARRGDEAERRVQLELARLLGARDVELDLALAAARSARGDAAGALDLLRELPEPGPPAERRDLALRRARAALGADRLDEGEAAIAALLDGPGVTADTLRLGAEIARRRGDHEALADRLARLAVLDEVDEDARLWLARRHLESGRAEAALTLLEDGRGDGESRTLAVEAALAADRPERARVQLARLVGRVGLTSETRELAARVRAAESP